MIYICGLCRLETDDVYVDSYTGSYLCRDCYFADDDEEEDNEEDDE